MGKKSSAPPPAPDYTGAAEKTSASNQEAQTRADWSNRPTINTPWGTESWTAGAGVDPSNGKAITNWTQNTTLTPESQAALDSQMRLMQGRSNLGESFMSRVADEYSQPFDYSNLQDFGQGGNVAGNMGAGRGIQRGLGDSDSMEARTRIEDAMFERMRPEQERQTAGMEAKLANQGLTPGSEAYNREMQRMGDQQSRERFNVLDRGLSEQQGQFGMGQAAGEFRNQAQAQGFGQRMGAQGQQFGQQMQQSQYQNQLRQQQIAEQMQKRGMSLNEMNALLSGQQVGMPNMPSFNQSQSSGGVDYSGAANMDYNAAMGGYNAKQAQGAQTGQAIGGVASMAMMAF